MAVTKFYKGNRYFYVHEAKQVTFLGWKFGLAMVKDDKGIEDKIPAHELEELVTQVDDDTKEVT